MLPSATHTLVMAQWHPGLEIGPYRLERLLGRGGGGELWLANEVRLNRRIAIKTLARQDADDGSAERFAREARSLAQLNHPSIVSVYDVGRHEETRYLTMEYVDGPDLAKVIAQGDVRIEWGARIAQQAAEALLYAHGAGVVHRDIKPGNILIDQRYDRAKLSDFGLAKLTSYGTITPVGSLFGTLAYAPPEQLRGEETSARSDVFSLGATLYHLFTGLSPRPGNDIAQLIERAQSRPAAAATVRADIPKRLSTVLHRMLDPEPTQRDGALDELLEVVSRMSTPAPQSPVQESLAERAIERPSSVAAPAVSNLTLMAGQASVGFFDAAVFPKTQFFKDESDRFLKIQETLQFYRDHLNNEYQTLLRQATLTYRLWLACVSVGFIILLAGVGAMLSGRISEGAATAASTIVVFFIQRVFQQREDHYRSLARSKNAHLEYGNQWLLVIQSIDSINNPQERANRQSRLVDVLTAKLSAVQPT